LGLFDAGTPGFIRREEEIAAMAVAEVDLND
jgi:hypothetical protein